MLMAQIKATNKLNAYVKEGIVKKSEKCENCGIKDKPLDAHHHLGYTGFNALRVRWLCKKCHKKEHPYIANKGKMEKFSFKGSYRIQYILKNFVVSAWVRKAIAEKISLSNDSIDNRCACLIEKGDYKILVTMLQTKMIKKILSKNVDLNAWVLSAIYEKMLRDRLQLG